MEKLRFDFVVKQTEDGKSNVICITSLATPDGHVFAVPEEYQPAHQEITNTSNYVKIKKTLNKRHQTRKIWVTLTDDISKVYLDEEQNLQFKDFYLEENLEKPNIAEPIPSTSNQTLEILLEKLLEDKQSKSETQNLGIIANGFMIEKFTGRNTNAYQWITDFNKECERFQFNEDTKKIELLKNFMEQCSLDWYNCMLMKLTVDSEWNRWEKHFCETFANKGWSPIRYALTFKYQAGMLLEYALKKEKLLLEVRKLIDTGTFIDLIATYESDKIDRETLQGTEDLYSEIGKLEHLVGKNRYERKSTINLDNKTKKLEEKNHKAVVKSVNNSELGIKLNEKNPKKLEVPPFIEVKLLLNDTLKVTGIYDSGSNVSLMNAKLLKIQPVQITSDIQMANLKTINGEKKT